MLEKNKVRCSECNWQGHENDVLVAPNPFNLSNNVEGCPDCLEIETIERVCDKPNCGKIATCGFKSANDGYRRTCGNHYDVVL